MYTLSFDASLKVKKGGVKGFLHHTARDVDRGNGVEVNHSNPNIDPERTGDNQTFYHDSGTQDWEECRDLGQIEKVLDERLRTVKKPLRKDAVVIRGLVLQLDPEWYSANRDDEDKCDESLDDMLEWAEKTFGKENLISVSSHKDEGSPHLHILFTPVTEDGRLSQKDWFKSPSSLREMHDSFRSHMIDKGYEIDMERKPVTKRLSEKDYRTMKGLEQANMEAADALISQYEDMQSDIGYMVARMDAEREEYLGEIAAKAYEQSRRDDQLDAKRRNVDKYKSDVIKWAEGVKKDTQERKESLKREKAEFEAKKQEVDKLRTEYEKGLNTLRKQNEVYAKAKDQYHEFIDLLREQKSPMAETAQKNLSAVETALQTNERLMAGERQSTGYQYGD